MQLSTFEQVAAALEARDEEIKFLRARLDRHLGMVERLQDLIESQRVNNNRKFETLTDRVSAAELRSGGPVFTPVPYPWPTYPSTAPQPYWPSPWTTCSSPCSGTSSAATGGKVTPV